MAETLRRENIWFPKMQRPPENQTFHPLLTAATNINNRCFVEPPTCSEGKTTVRWPQIKENTRGKYRSYVMSQRAHTTELEIFLNTGLTRDNDNGIWGARNMWTRTWQRSIQGRRSAREEQPCLYRLKLFFLFLLANNLLTLFSIYWLEDAALNQLVSQRATERLIDFVTVITSFSGKVWLLHKHAGAGFAAQVCMLIANSFFAQRLWITASAWKKINKKTALICKDCRNQTSLVW